jgi:opacity protein-like surface antigen
MTIKKTLTLAVLLVIASYQLSAQDKAKTVDVRLLLSGALEFGGDEVAQIYFTNGETQSVNAGQGGTVAVGAQFQFLKVPQFLLRTTLGFKYVTTQADNAHIRLSRLPIQATANWMITDKFRIGAGLVTHQNIRFKADGITQDIRFSSASGPVFEVAYRSVGLSYTLMTYKDQANVTYNANAFGVTFSGVIKKKAVVKNKKPISPVQQK